MQTLEPFKIKHLSPEATISIGGFSLIPSVNRSLTDELLAFERKFPGFADAVQMFDGKQQEGPHIVKKDHFAKSGLGELRGIMEAHLPPEIKGDVEHAMRPANCHLTLVHGIDTAILPLFSIGLYAWKEMDVIKHKLLKRAGPPEPQNYADIWHRDSGDLSVFAMGNNRQQAATSFVNLDAVLREMTQDMKDKFCILIPRRVEGWGPDMSDRKPKTLTELEGEHYRAWAYEFMRVNELYLFTPPANSLGEGILQTVPGLDSVEEGMLKRELLGLFDKHRVDITLGQGQVLIVSNGDNWREKYADLGRIYHRATPGIVQVPADEISRLMYASIANVRGR